MMCARGYRISLPLANVVAAGRGAGNVTIAQVDQAPESRLTRRESLLLSIAIAIYFAGSCVIAQIRMLWYDEIFTRQVAILGSWGRIVTALRHGIDLQPPLFYYVTYWTRAIGSEEIGIRLPAMVGFSFTAFALYRIARRWFSPGYAMGVAITPAIFFFQALGLEATAVRVGPRRGFARAARLVLSRSLSRGGDGRVPRRRTGRGVGTLLRVHHRNSVRHIGTVDFAAEAPHGLWDADGLCFRGAAESVESGLDSRRHRNL